MQSFYYTATASLTLLFTSNRLATANQCHAALLGTTGADKGGNSLHKGYLGLKLHDLHHTQATLLIADGVDIKTVQDRMGHEKASTTLDMYASVLPGKDRVAAAKIGSIISARLPKEPQALSA